WQAYSSRARCRFNLGDFQAAVADATRAIDLGADDHRSWMYRGMAYWYRGKSKEALADFDKVTTFPDLSTRTWERVIRARAALGDAAGYRRACTVLMERVGGKGAESELNWWAWLCVLAPEALADPGQAVRLAEKAYQAAPDDATRNTLGASLYRAGKWEQAVQTLEENQGTNAAFDWLFLAMAHHRLDHADKAREFLKLAVDWMDAATQGKAVVPSIGEPPNVDQRIEL